jgi:hypothetical protein
MPIIIPKKRPILRFDLEFHLYNNPPFTGINVLSLNKTGLLHRLNSLVIKITT